MIPCTAPLGCSYPMRSSVIAYYKRYSIWEGTKLSQMQPISWWVFDVCTLLLVNVFYYFNVYFFPILPQIVTANMKEFGCARKFCATLNMPSGISWPDRYFYVCYYSVPEDNEPAYIQGEPASQCPEDAPKKDGYFCVSSAPAGCPYYQTLMATAISLFLSFLS